MLQRNNLHRSIFSRKEEKIKQKQSFQVSLERRISRAKSTVSNISFPWSFNFKLKPDTNQSFILEVEILHLMLFTNVEFSPRPQIVKPVPFPVDVKGLQLSFYEIHMLISFTASTEAEKTSKRRKHRGFVHKKKGFFPHPLHCKSDCQGCAGQPALLLSMPLGKKKHLSRVIVTHYSPELSRNSLKIEPIEPFGPAVL